MVDVEEAFKKLKVVVEQSMEYITELERKLKVAEEFLGNYADEQWYDPADLFDAETPPKHIFYDEFYYPPLEDRGEAARRALKQIRGG